MCGSGWCSAGLCIKDRAQSYGASAANSIFIADPTGIREPIDHAAPVVAGFTSQSEIIEEVSARQRVGAGAQESQRHTGFYNAAHSLAAGPCGSSSIDLRGDRTAVR
jgi:hypothetical protein